jgi:FkbM family methyltransferase
MGHDVTMKPAALDEPMLVLADDVVQTTSVKARAFLRLYRVIGGFLVRGKFRGRSWIRRRTVERVAADFAVVKFAEDALFRFPMRDRYWNRLFLQGFEYEPALYRVLRQLAPHDYAFLDCGANFGYWSVMVSSAAMGRKPALAIEALRNNCSLLQENCTLNSNRFSCWHRAVFSRAGEQVSIFVEETVHYGASLRRDWHEAGSEETVMTTTIDEAASHLCDFSQREKLVIKLDVEGVEVEALTGGKNAISKGALVIYEDHPRDREHEATRYLLDMGLDVRLLSKRGPIPIIELAELTRQKQRPDYEYNLAAFARGSWAHRIIDGAAEHGN